MAGWESLIKSAGELTTKDHRFWMAAANKIGVEPSNFVPKLASCYKGLERLNRFVLNGKLR
jgi:hypothetical protein